MFDSNSRQVGPNRRLTRSSREKMISGVAGGLSEYFDLDPTIMRLIWVAATVVSGGLALPAYGVLWIVMPVDSDVKPPSPVVPNVWVSTPTGPSGEAPFVTAANAPSGDDMTSKTVTNEPVVAGETAGPAGEVWPGYVGLSGIGPSGVGPSGVGSAGVGATVGNSGPYVSSLPPVGPSTSSSPRWERGGRRKGRTAGAALIVLGILFLGSTLGLFDWSIFRYIWPLALVALGVAVLLGPRARGV